MMECALKHVEIQMGNLLLLMGDDPLSPEVEMTSCMHCLCAGELNFNLCGFLGAECSSQTDQPRNVSISNIT